MNSSWEYFINLSGQDFPLKSQAQIATFLEGNRGKEFIKVADQKLMRPDTMPRVEKYAVEVRRRVIQTRFRRRFLKGAVPYIGNQWMIVSRPFCEFVCHDPQAARYKTFYKNTFIADEGFFQTVMKNTSVHGDIVNDDMREIDWVPDGVIKLRPRTFTIEDASMLTASAALFARKFDETVDSAIFKVLENHLLSSDPAAGPNIPKMTSLTLAAA
jgi:hypothetical protein